MKSQNLKWKSIDLSKVKGGTASNGTYEESTTEGSFKSKRPGLVTYSNVTKTK